MKKFLGILLLLLFAFTIVFSISNDLNTSKNDKASGYAAIIPIPPPDPPARRGA
jgi:hypothetical protein